MSTSAFSQHDLEHIRGKGIQRETIEEQLRCFSNGFPYMRLQKPATLNNGILKFTDDQLELYAQNFDTALSYTQVVKFVPASGAASRMFKHLFEYMKATDEKKQKYLGDENDFNSVHYFVTHLSSFAFYSILKEKMQSAGISIDDYIEQKKYTEVLEFILTDKGLNLGEEPKGQIPFHTYNDHIRRAFEEHLVEGALYCADEKKKVRMHFTLSPEHIADFEQLIKQVKGKYEEAYGVKFEISHSIQKPSTDTIAADRNNNPFRTNNGDLVFRPGGHGALIENLNEIKADIIFIKNIDNLVPDSRKDLTVLYKKALGGYLLDLKTVVDEYLELLLEGCSLETDILNDVQSFAKVELNIDIPSEFSAWPTIQQADFLIEKLNRPIRVCGMVKNEGEPGGGPFIVTNADQTSSLQIVEKSQIDPKDAEQQKIVAQSTHFNPVDLVCCTTQHQGGHFHLPDFVDPETGFISEKSVEGRALKALELPGLWNGAMANWNTIFVEVPIETFNPVKTVNDLLRKEHQQH